MVRTRKSQTAPSDSSAQRSGGTIRWMIVPFEGALLVVFVCVILARGTQAQVAGGSTADTDAIPVGWVVGLAQNFEAAMYVFDGPSWANNMANCGTARGAALNYGLYLTCVPIERASEPVRLGARETWVTVFEASGDPVLTFVFPGWTRKDNMEACKQVLRVPTHVGWTCRPGGARKLGRVASGS